MVSRRSFLALASGLLVPEPERIVTYSFPSNGWIAWLEGEAYERDRRRISNFHRVLKELYPPLRIRPDEANPFLFHLGREF